MRGPGLLVLVLAVGCGAKTGLEVSGAASGGDGGGATHRELEAAPCRVTDRWTVYAGADEPYAAKVSEDGGQIGVLYWSDDLVDGLRELQVARVDAAAPRITTWIPILASPVITEAGLATYASGLHIAWIDPTGTVDESLVGTSDISSAVMLGKNIGLGAATIGVTGGGHLDVFWADASSGSTSLRVSTSADGANFSKSAVVATADLASALSLAPAPSGAALAWSAQTHEPDGSELVVAMVDESGIPTAPATRITHHPKRYVYDVAITRAKNSLVIATTDSRDDIGTVPLYATSLSLDGTWSGTDTRLTTSGGHEKLDLAFDGASSVLAYDEFIGPGSQVFVRQLDGQGHDLFGPLQVSNATYLESNCCTRTSDVKIATDGQGRVTVFWTEAVARHDGAEGKNLEAARLDCARRP